MIVFILPLYFLFICKEIKGSGFGEIENVVLPRSNVTTDLVTDHVRLRSPVTLDQQDKKFYCEIAILHNFGTIITIPLLSPDFISDFSLLCFVLTAQKTASH